MTELSEVMMCQHCGNRAPMEIVAQWVHDIGDDWVQAQRRYEILFCLSCHKPSLRCVGWNELMEPEEIEETILYPEMIDPPLGLPKTIQKAFESARRVKSVDANAYGVLVGRLLEFICEDQKAEGKDLFSKLNDLSTKGIIPDRLSAIAQGLRQLRNIGAHATLGELTEAEVPLLEKLSRAILEYVYTAPTLAAQAEEQLAKLKSVESP